MTDPVVVVEDAIGEWWIWPLATQLGQRTVGGAISSTGEILAIEMNDVTGAKKRVVVGQTDVDDHNCPALWAAEGERMVIAWNTHGVEPRLYFKVSDTAGNVDSLANATLQNYTTGVGVSYTQIHRIKHLSNSTQNTFWCFFRYGTYSWRFVSFSVSKATGSITFGAEVPMVQAVSPRQCYLTTADSHSPDGEQQVVRVAWGYNPAQPVHAIRYLEINTVTGAVTSPDMPGFSANINGTNLPVQEDAITAAVPESQEGYSRRLFYIRGGPIGPAIAYADWPLTDPDAAVYRVSSLSPGGGWSVKEYGVAGPRVGYTSNANYISGMSFPSPCYDETVATAHRLNGTSEVLVHRAGGRVEKAAFSRHAFLMRPNFPANQQQDLLVSGVTYYGENYKTYRAYVWYVGAQRALFRLQSGARVLMGRKV